MHCSVGVDIISILYHLYVDISLLAAVFSVITQRSSPGSLWGIELVFLGGSLISGIGGSTFDNLWTTLLKCVFPLLICLSCCF